MILIFTKIIVSIFTFPLSTNFMHQATIIVTILSKVSKTSALYFITHTENEKKSQEYKVISTLLRNIYI